MIKSITEKLPGYYAAGLIIISFLQYLISYFLYQDLYAFIEEHIPYLITFLLAVLLSVALVNRIKLTGKKKRQSRLRYHEYWIILCCAFLIDVCISSILYAYGIGFAGGEASKLPFRIGGVIYNYKMQISPIILSALSVFSIYYRIRFRLIVIICYGIVIFYTILLTGSRGILINYSFYLIIPLIALRCYKIKAYHVLAFLLIFLVIKNYITMYRLSSLGGDYEQETNNIIFSLFHFIERFKILSGFYDIYSGGFSGTIGLKSLFFDDNVRIYTNEILGYPIESNHRSSPGYLGMITWMSDSLIIIFCVSIFMHLIFFSVVKKLSRMNSIIWYVIVGNVFWQVAFCFLEGTFYLLPFIIFVLTINTFVLKFLDRLLIRYAEK